MRVRNSQRAGAFLVLSLGLASATYASAQSEPSVEDIYVARCSEGQKSELCKALGKQLVQDAPSVPNGQGSAPAAGTHTVSAFPSAPRAGTLRQRWGYLADVAGKNFYTTSSGFKPSIQTYRWEVPGQSLVSTTYYATKTGEIKDDPNCPDKTFFRLDGPTQTLIRSTQATPCSVSSALPVVVQADGTIIINHVNGKNRVRSWLNNDGSITRWTEVHKGNGQWKRMAYGTSTGRELTPALLASLRDSSGGNGLFGAVLGGLVMGAAGMDAPLMNPDGSGANALDVLNGVGTAINRQTQEQQAQFERQMRSNSGVGGSSGGAIIMDDTPAPNNTPSAPVIQSAPPTQTHSTPPSTDKCKRREPRTYGHGANAYTIQVCLDVSTVSEQ